MDAAIPLCQDGMQDQDESDVDCGGSTCPKCADRMHCGADADCASGTCASGLCASCTDGVQDGAETDVDCGGPTCAACDIGQRCARNRDCATGACSGGRCSRPLGTLSFAAGVDYPVGEAPFGIGAGDFDGDGDLDLATPAYDAVYVLTGRGNGTFVVQAPLAAATGRNVAVADFDEDGRDDFAVGSRDEAVVRLWSNGLKRPTQLAWHGSPWELVAADVDGDHHADIAVLSGSGSLELVRGDGKGGFPMLVDVPLDQGSSGYKIAAGDLNGDGRADLAVSLAGNSMQIVFGGKNGVLQPGLVANPVPKPGTLGAVVAGDVDGDGRRDVVLAGSGPDLAYVFLGDGKGKVAQASTVAVPSNAYIATVADFNRDGFEDVAFACDVNKRVQVLLSDGRGGLGAGPTLVLPSWVFGVVAADFDGDGKPDLAAAAGTFNGGQVTVFLNTSH